MSNLKKTDKTPGSGTKEKLLDMLQSAGAEYTSGSAVGERLGISRSAVWKAVRSLCADGYEIESVTNRGYRLCGCNDVLSAGVITSLLDKDLDIRAEVYASLPSTNTAAALRAAAGEREGLLIIAASQTDGSGRYGRSFFSPADSGVYFSLLLKPQADAEKSLFVTTAAAVALCGALRGLSGRVGEPGIKWVNDIYINGKKVCGILTRAALNLEENRPDYIILGVGVNLYTPAGGFPADISQRAGAVLSEKTENAKNLLIAGFINSFMPMYRSFDRGAVAEEYRKLDITAGKRVKVLAGSHERWARALRTDDACRLLVRFEDEEGEEAALSSGEITRIILE